MFIFVRKFDSNLDLLINTHRGGGKGDRVHVFKVNHQPDVATVYYGQLIQFFPKGTWGRVEGREERKVVEGASHSSASINVPHLL